MAFWGVDSSVLVALAVRALGVDRVVPILGVSPSLSSEERLAAHQVARTIGIAVVEVATYEGERAAYVANGPDRCFHCKDELFSRIADEVVTSQRLDAVATARTPMTPRDPIGRAPARPPTTACCGRWPTRA